MNSEDHQSWSKAPKSDGWSTMYAPQPFITFTELALLAEFAPAIHELISEVGFAAGGVTFAIGACTQYRKGFRPNLENPHSFDRIGTN